MCVEVSRDDALKFTRVAWCWFSTQTIMATATQCLGRHVRYGPNGMMSFDSDSSKESTSKLYFHIPFRCDKMGLENGLCVYCLERERQTDEKVVAAGGAAISATHQSLLHGRVGEPIPSWSHIFGGAWFNLKMESGYTISTAAMTRVKKAVEAIEPGGILPGAEPMPEGRRRKAKGSAPMTEAKGMAQAILEGRSFLSSHSAAAAKVTAAGRATTPPQPPLTITVPKAPPSPTTPASTTSVTPGTAKKRGPKKASGGATTKATATATSTATPVTVATAFADPTDKVSPVEDIVHIVVRRVTIDGRTLYLDPKKQKLYDMKYKYVGRYDSAGERINRDFPDSDVEP